MIWWVGLLAVPWRVGRTAPGEVYVNRDWSAPRCSLHCGTAVSEGLTARRRRPLSPMSVRSSP